MEWDVTFHDDFEGEFDELSEAVQDAILAGARLLAKFGSSLQRPHADTLNGSKHANMKELRCNADNGVWRIAFAFDPDRKAILLTAGDKADTRFDQHLASQVRRK